MRIFKNIRRGIYIATNPLYWLELFLTLLKSLFDFLTKKKSK